MIELSVIVLILAVLAATVVPRLLAYRQGSEVRSFATRLQGLAEEARTRSSSSGEVVRLTFSESDRRFGLQLESNEDSSGRLAMPDAIELEASRSGSEQASGGDWSMRFFPDGTCEGGGIQFDFDGDARTLTINGKSGRSKWIAGPLAEPTDERWQAGELEIRGEGQPRS